VRALLPILGALAAANGAWAQVSGSVALVSDYRYRGVSESGERPALQASLAYDAPSGWYAGAFVSTMARGEEAGTGLRALSYLGYARSLREGYAWDAGFTYSADLGRTGYDYPEVHLGLTGERFSARLSWAEDYFGQSHRAVYGELELWQPLAEGLRLLGHLGLLRLTPGSAGADRARADLRAGIAMDLGPYALALSWVGRDGPPLTYPAGDPGGQSALVLSLSRPF
jgi:uncharacterized protein (TIGR02001 family)